MSKHEAKEGGGTYSSVIYCKFPIDKCQLTGWVKSKKHQIFIYHRGTYARSCKSQWYGIGCSVVTMLYKRYQWVF